MSKPPCHHCRERVGVCPGRLCRRCWLIPEVRERYRGHERAREPTQAELDRLVAEQMANLPPWWGSAGVAEDDGRSRRGA